MRTDVHIKEIPKRAEILDPGGNVWFSVVLMYDEFPAREPDEFYRVIVVNHRHPEGDMLVLEYPVPPKRLSNYGAALEKFREYERDYRSVVKASIQDAHRMSTYSDRIGYRESAAKCCATCQFCREVPVTEDWYYGKTGKFECWNPENALEKYLGVRDRELRHWHHFVGEPVDKFVESRGPRIRPEVNALDVCDNYLRRDRRLKPVGGQSLAEFVDMRIGHRLDERISSAVSAGLDESALSAPVANALSVVLSSIDVSAAIEKPMADVLDSGAISANFDSAVAKSVPTAEVSAEIIDVVSRGIKINKIDGNDGEKSFGAWMTLGGMGA